jgi:hypothetical protein
MLSESTPSGLIYKQLVDYNISLNMINITNKLKILVNVVS